MNRSRTNPWVGPALTVALAVGGAGMLAAAGPARAQPQTAERDDSEPAPEQGLAEARAQMERARQELEAAARRVAELSGEASRRLVQRLEFGSRGARLGVNIEDAEGGALVIGVTPGGGAAEAGVEVGDRVLEIDGIDLTQGDAARKLVEYLGQVEPGTEVELRISRDGERQSVSVETREPNRYFFAGLPGPPGIVTAPAVPGVDAPGAPPAVRVWSGDGPNFTIFDRRPFVAAFAARWADMELASLSEALGSYFGTSEGLLVVRAPADAELGLMDGDVILRIGDRTPTTPEHAMGILASFAPGETLELEIMRHSRRQTLEYALPEN